jgi:hypothetical protein
VSSTEIGESLVGAYLRYIEGCSLVLYNCFLGDKQGEVDVVAIKAPVGDQPRTVYLCEVTTHIGGMSAPMVRKVPAKLDRVREYADATFPGEPHRFQWWSPYVSKGAATTQFDVLRSDWAARGLSVEFIINDLYTRRLDKLVEHARVHSSATSEPAYRMLQMLTRLRGDKPTL